MRRNRTRERRGAKPIRGNADERATLRTARGGARVDRLACLLPTRLPMSYLLPSWRGLADAEQITTAFELPPLAGIRKSGANTNGEQLLVLCYGAFLVNLAKHLL